jgi:small subunit ribosomal protein S18
MTQQRSGGGGRRGGGRGRFYARRKVCGFCVNKVKHIDYKNIEVLKNYVSDRFKMDARRKTGTCSRHQRALAAAIKRARIIALLPFSPSHAGMDASPRR